jgi:prepilin signal peptidase PulO-like enzyme (type II secretory pathway)
MMPLLWVVAVFLLITGIIDWKIRKIPSIFLTGMLFVVAFISISINPNALSLGVLGFIMAYLLYEADYFGGIADVKIMTMISFMLLNTYWLLASFVLIGVFGITWKAIMKIRTGEKECAFLPVFFFVFTALFLLKGVF